MATDFQGTVTIRVARDQVCNHAAAISASLRQGTPRRHTDLLADLLPSRRPRQYTWIRKSAEEHLPGQEARPHPRPSRVIYKIKLTRKDLLPVKRR